MGADMVDGTPIVDIKPYLAFVDSVGGAISVEKPTARLVVFTDNAEQDFEVFLKNNKLNQEDKYIISELIAQDPRPAYRQHEIGVVCTMRYKAVDVDFFMDKGEVLVIMQLRVVGHT